MKDFVIRQLIQMKFETFKDTDNIENVYKQVLQEIILYCLSKGKFFNNVAFHGGTSLRIFHNLDRFSEDLDFALIKKVKGFNIKDYFKELENNVKFFGLTCTIKAKNFDERSGVQSCLIKFATFDELCKLWPDRKFEHMHSDSVTKIKFDVDTRVYDSAKSIDIIKTWPLSYRCCLHSLPTSFAGKINAVLCRKWKNRVKGRDLYDYLFYLGKGVKFNMDYLKDKLIECGKWEENKPISLNDVKNLLKEKFKTIDYETASLDVKAFISDSDSVKYWSSDFFIKTLDNLNCEE